MRSDVLAVLREYKEEILNNHLEYTDPDWWHYLHDASINVHDWEGTGKVHVNVYDWFEDVGTVDMQDSYEFTLEEFSDL